MKNTLATVQSIVWQALRTATDPKVIRESIDSRLFALSRSHDLLTSENWEGTGLVDLINDALEPFGAADNRAERFVITGENIRFPPNPRLALGIAFNELATNAVKYGAFSMRWIDPCRMEARAGLAGRPDNPALAGEGRSACNAALTYGVRLAGDRAWFGPRTGSRGESRLPAGGAALHDEHSGAEGNSRWISCFAAVACWLLRMKC